MISGFSEPLVVADEQATRRRRARGDVGMVRLGPLPEEGRITVRAVEIPRTLWRPARRTGSIHFPANRRISIVASFPVGGLYPAGSPRSGQCPYDPRRLRTPGLPPVRQAHRVALRAGGIRVAPGWVAGGLLAAAFLSTTMVAGSTGGAAAPTGRSIDANVAGAHALYMNSTVYPQMYHNPTAQKSCRCHHVRRVTLSATKGLCISLAQCGDSSRSLP